MVQEASHSSRYELEGDEIEGGNDLGDGSNKAFGLNLDIDRRRMHNKCISKP